MGFIGSLRIGASLAIEKLVKGAKYARSSLTKLEKTTQALKTGFVGAGVGVASASAAMGYAIKSIVDQQMPLIDRTSKLSQQLGVTTKSLTSMRFAAEQNGVSAGEMDATLLRVSRRVGLFAKGAGAAAAGLKQLGFSQDELTGMNTEQQFKAIIERIRQMPTAAQRAGAAFEILGDSGQKFLPLIEGGTAGMEELQKEAEALGITFSDVDGHQVAMAGDALNRVTKISEGFKQQLTIQLAPIITAVANKFTDMAKAGFSAGKFVTTGIEILVKGIGMAADVVQTLRIAFKLLQAGVTAALGWFIKGWALTGQAIEKVLNMLPGVEVSFTDTITAIGDDLIKLSKDQYGEFQSELMKEPPSTGINQFFSDLKKESAATAQAMAENANSGTRSFDEAAVKGAKSVHDLTKRMQEQIDTFGMAGNAIEIWKLKQQEGVSAEMIADLEKLNKKLEDLADDKKLEDWGKSLEQSLMTPLEKFNQELGMLDKALEKKLITQDIYNKAVEKFKEDLKKSDDKNKDKTDTGKTLAGALDFRSAEARSVVLRSRLAGQNPVIKAQQDQLKEQKKSNQHLAKIADHKPQVFKISPS